MTGPVGLQECIDCISWKQMKKGERITGNSVKHAGKISRMRTAFLKRTGHICWNDWDVKKQRRKGLSRHLPICSIGHRGWMRKIILFFWIIF